ncbi:MAG: urate oxidase [Caldilineaceae bacterium]|nr:urate oxidase [Caldilineaceae bacterium]
MKLAAHTYGKARVRVLRLVREQTRHRITEISFDLALLGGFDRAYTHGDNADVVPTDTMKNTVYVMACEHPDLETEPLGLKLAQGMLERYGHVSEVRIDMVETPWHRLDVNGSAHPHSFVQSQACTPMAQVVATRAGHTVRSGFRNLALMKTTGSGFAGFLRDEVTTLPEVDDRILATRVQADWTYGTAPSDYARTSGIIRRTLEEVFAATYSKSVQDSLWRMGGTVLERIPEVENITLSMPNLHYHAIDLTRFGLDSSSHLFLPTDEPHGHIEATVARER